MSTAPRPCHLYLFLEQKLSSVRGQATSTINLSMLVKTHCKLGEGKEEWGCTPVRGKRICTALEESLADGQERAATLPVTVDTVPTYLLATHIQANKC